MISQIRRSASLVLPKVTPSPVSCEDSKDEKDEKDEKEEAASASGSSSVSVEDASSISAQQRIDARSQLGDFLLLLFRLRASPAAYVYWASSECKSEFLSLMVSILPHIHLQSQRVALRLLQFVLLLHKDDSNSLDASTKTEFVHSIFHQVSWFVSIMVNAQNEFFSLLFFSF